MTGMATDEDVEILALMRQAADKSIFPDGCLIFEININNSSNVGWSPHRQNEHVVFSNRHNAASEFSEQFEFLIITKICA